MAGKIQGITIELNGDTKGLDSALKEVTKQSINLGNELKIVEQRLKLDPGNADLAAQKQQLLSQAIETTSKKLEVLRNAQDQVKKQFESKTITHEQYIAFQRELAQTEQRMRSLTESEAKFQAEQAAADRSTRTLTQTVSEQEKKLAALKSQYVEAAASQGANSNEARRLAGEIRLLSGELAENKQKLREAEKAADSLDRTMQQAESGSKTLSKTIEKQKSELSDLKTKYADVVAAQGENSDEAKALAAQIKSLSGELKDNKGKLSEAEKAADKLDRTIDDLGDSEAETEGKTHKLGSALKNGLAAGAKAAGAALKASLAAIGAASAAALKFAKDSVSVGMGFDSAMSQVAATSGKTMDEMLGDIQTVTVNGKEFTGNLRDYALEMGSTTAFSANQAAEALNYMALAGYDTATSMQMLPNVLNLAAAGGMELARASDMVTDVSSALGLSLDETSQLVDKMAAAASKSNTSVAQLGEAMLKIGGTAKNLKGGTTELSAALGILADNGIKGAEGGTHLRNVVLSLQSPTNKAAAQLKALGVAVYDADGEMRGMNEIFGDLTAAMAGMNDQEQDLVKSTLFNNADLSAVNALLVNMGGRYDELSAAIDGAWYSTSSLESALSDVSQYGEAVGLNTVKSHMEELGVSATAFDAALAACNGDAGAFVDALLKSASSGTAYDDVLDSIGFSLDELQTAFNQTTGAAQAMADTQLDNLDGDITLFKSALEGAQVTLSDSLTPTLRDFVSIGTDGVTELTNAFKKGGLSGAINALGPILSRVIQKASKMIPSIIAVATEIVTALAVALPTLLQAILPPLISGVVQVVTALAGQLPTILTIISDSMPILLDAILTILPDLINTGLQIIAQLALGIADALPTLIPTIVDVVLQIVDTLIDNIDLLVDAAIALIMGLADGLINAMPVLIDKIPTIVEKLVNALVNNAPLLLKAAWELVVKLRDGIGQNLGKLVESAGKIVTSLRDGILNFRAKMTETAKELLQSMVSEVKTWPDKALTWGKDMLQGFINGIKSNISGIKNAVSNIGETIKSYLHFSVPDEGPLTDYESWMPDMMQGLAKGIVKNMKYVKGAVSDLAAAMIPDVNLAPALAQYDASRLKMPDFPQGRPTPAGGAPSGYGGGSTYYITINVERMDSDTDVRRAAEVMAQEIDRLTQDNNNLKGAWSV